ncbi:MAG TPA: hypothetical protein VG269_13045 [Tepidisphaeraceae bacterium]|jgi:hypothetical protein|nr:hypothetical protein [Tepidisphaeraceae bacterium]
MCAVFYVVGGCSETTGVVQVGNPEVFTRARLVDARLAESQWLAKQLDVKYAPSFQGLSDRRLVENLAENLSLSFAQPPATGTASKNKTGGGQTGGGTGSAGTGSSGAESGSAGSGGGTSGGASSGDGGGKTGSTGSNSDGSGSNSGTDAGNTSGASGSAKQASSGQSYAAPTPQKSTAELSMVDQLRDQLAYRNEVNANIREQQLDDTHDLRGYTLYSMKFDASILPGERSHHFAIVLLDVNGEKDDKKTPDDSEFSIETYKRWLSALDAELQEETRRAEGLLLRNQFSDQDLLRVEGSLFTGPTAAAYGANRTPAPLEKFNIAAKDGVPQWDEIAQTFASFILKTEADRASFLADPKNDKAILLLKAAVALAIRDRFVLSTAGYADLQPVKLVAATTSAADDANKAIFLNGVQPDSDTSSKTGHYQKLKAYLQSLNLPAKVLSVTPAEYAQNASDVSSRQDALDLMLAISAAHAGVGVQNTTDYQRQSQMLLNAIKRQPLAVAVHNGANQLGLIIGPKFAISDNLKAEFTHVPTRYTFSADVAVPAWWDRVKLSGKYYWLDDNGNISEGIQLWTEQPLSKNGTLIVHLPSDPTALTSAIGFQTNSTQRPPQIDPPEQGSRAAFYLQATSTVGARRGAPSGPGANDIPTTPSSLQSTDPGQSILIRGRDLWRNPKVFVGSQQADQVDVLPDMNGLLAHFHALMYPVAPQGLSPDKNRQDLMVVTSFGYDVVRGAVEISPPPKSETSGLNAFATFKAHYVVGGTPNNLTITLNSDAVPVAGLSAVMLKLKRHNDPEANWVLIPNDKARPQFSATQISYTLPPDFQSIDPKLAAPPYQAAGGAVPSVAAPYDLDLRLIGNPNEPEKSVLSGGPATFVYFNSEDARKLQYGAPVKGGTYTAAQGQPIQFAMQFDKFDPALLDIAYPGWRKAKLQAQLMQTPPSAAPPVGSGIGSAIASESTVQVSIPWKALSPADGETYSVTIMADDKSLSIPAAGNLTISVPKK